MLHSPRDETKKRICNRVRLMGLELLNMMLVSLSGEGRSKTRLVVEPLPRISKSRAMYCGLSRLSRIISLVLAHQGEREE
jgi:hypothetical protein